MCDHVNLGPCHKVTAMPFVQQGNGVDWRCTALADVDPALETQEGSGKAASAARPDSLATDQKAHLVIGCKLPAHKACDA